MGVKFCLENESFLFGRRTRSISFWKWCKTLCSIRIKLISEPGKMSQVLSFQLSRLISKRRF